MFICVVILNITNFILSFTLNLSNFHYNLRNENIAGNVSMTLFLGEIDSISDIDLFYHGFQQNVLGVTKQKNQRNADISAGNIEKEIRGYPYDRLLPEKALKSINV